MTDKKLGAEPWSAEEIEKFRDSIPRIDQRRWLTTEGIQRWLATVDQLTADLREREHYAAKFALGVYEYAQHFKDCDVFTARGFCDCGCDHLLNESALYKERIEAEEEGLRPEPSMPPTAQIHDEWHHTARCTTGGCRS